MGLNQQHPDSIRYLSGPRDGWTVRRFGNVVKLVGRNGSVIKSVECADEHGARSMAFELAEEAYRLPADPSQA